MSLDTIAKFDSVNGNPTEQIFYVVNSDSVISVWDEDNKRIDFCITDSILLTTDIKRISTRLYRYRCVNSHGVVISPNYGKPYYVCHDQKLVERLIHQVG